MAQLLPPDWAEMPIKVTYQNSALEYDENMECEDFLNMGMLPLEFSTRYKNTSECHEVPRLPRETKQRDIWNLQKTLLLQNLP